MDLSNKNIKELSTLDSKRTLFFIFFEWFLISSIFYTYFHFKIIWLLILLVPLMATRMYALYSLLHDGIHFLIVKNKNINDAITRVFLALPLFISLPKMRKAHFLHHKYLQTEQDPEVGHLKYEEFIFPMGKGKLLGIVMKDIVGYNFLKYKIVSLKNISFSCSFNYWSLFYYVIVLSLVMYFDFIAEFLLLWLIPYATFYQLLNRMRTYFEHFNIPDKSYKIRTFEFNGFYSFFIAPYSLGFHTEHHLYPSIPNYNLRKIHQYLKVEMPLKVFSEKNIRSIFSNILK